MVTLRNVINSFHSGCYCETLVHTLSIFFPYVRSQIRILKSCIRLFLCNPYGFEGPNVDIEKDSRRCLISLGVANHGGPREQGYFLSDKGINIKVSFDLFKTSSPGLSKGPLFSPGTCKYQSLCSLSEALRFGL